MMADYNIQPWGDDWDQTGLICATMGNLVRSKGKKPLSPDDFIPKRHRPRQSLESMVAILNMAAGITKRG